MAGQAPWTDVRLRAAWARADWAAILREYRRATGLTQQALETLVGMPQPHISAIESGRRQVRTAAVRARITEGLQVPRELVDAGQSDLYGQWEPSGELHARVARAYQAGRTDLRTARWISEVLATQRRAEDHADGAILWPVVRAQLDAVTRLLPGASGPTADQLLLLAAEHAHWLSWVAWRGSSTPRRWPGSTWRTAGPSTAGTPTWRPGCTGSAPTTASSAPTPCGRCARRRPRGSTRAVACRSSGGDAHDGDGRGLGRRAGPRAGTGR